MPFVIPKKIEIGNYNLNDLDLSNPDNSNPDLSKSVKLLLDDVPIDISKDTVNLSRIQKQITLHHKGESFSVEDIINGKLSGRTIGLGDTISVLIQLANETLTKLTKGKHSLVIESETISNLAIPFELDDNNINVKFDPSKA